MNLKKEDKGYVFISYEHLNEKGETDKLYGIGGQLTIEEYLKLCEENFPGCLMHFAKSLHNKNLPDVSQDKINVQPVKSKKDTKEPKTKNKDIYTECRDREQAFQLCCERIFQLSDVMENFLKASGMSNSDAFAAKMKLAAVKVEEALRAIDEDKKPETFSPQPNTDEDLKDMQAKAKVQEAREIFNCLVNKKEDNKEQPESKNHLPMIGFGIIGEDITDKEIEILMDFLSETGLLEFLPDKLMKEDGKLEFKPMDCDHKCFSCKSLGTCETIKRAMDKAKNTPIQ